MKIGENPPIWVSHSPTIKNIKVYFFSVLIMMLLWCIKQMMIFTKIIKKKCPTMTANDILR